MTSLTTAETHTAPAPQRPSLSPAAARRIAEIARAEGTSPVLRLTVDGGGCSGFQYRFDLAAAAAPDDTVVEVDGAQLVVDDISLPFLVGAEIDFVDDLMGASFRVTNPNASSSCGCGTSFAL